jgi:tetratricopeptide (TPR) repeat protein
MVLLGIILLAIGSVILVTVHEHNVHSKDTASQGLWETILHSSLADENKQQDVVNATTALLAGKKAGTFTISSTDQTNLYLDRANAYLNLKEYKKAVADYTKVVSMGGATKQAALQGQVEAGYKAGERKELIPLYKQLITLKSKSGDPMRSSIMAQYEENIQILQQGGELIF